LWLHSTARPPQQYLLKILSSFLADRCAILSHNGSSFEKRVEVGCPQGGVLSPFLWNVMIDDILRIVFPFLYLLIAYADDLAGNHNITPGSGSGNCSPSNSL
jgi:hypothetical protein